MLETHLLAGGEDDLDMISGNKPGQRFLDDLV
jgi:hypothetical protein